MHCVQSIKDKMSRYSPKLEHALPPHLMEAQTRIMGYIKRTKSVFSLGVQTLEIEILKCRAARILARRA